MHSKLFSFIFSLVIVFIIIAPKESAIAEPEAIVSKQPIFGNGLASSYSGLLYN